MNDTVTRNAVLVIYESENGRDGWSPLLPEEVPEWVKDADVLGRIKNGEIAMDPTKSTKWYCAQELRLAGDYDALLRAREKRERKAAARRAQMPSSNDETLQ